MNATETNRIIEGDAFDVLDELPGESVHAVVTDPPYALGDGFMSRDWDSFSDSHEYQAWTQRWATKALQVLKPGGHLLAFGGNTRHHRLFAGVEDAGFTVRDTVTFHFGSGFPKALDVSKSIDKRQRSRFVGQLDVEHLERAGIPNAQATYHDWTEGGHAPSGKWWGTLTDWIENSEAVEREVIETVQEAKNSDKFSGVYTDDYHGREYDVTAPATDEAKQWSGWKTHLKPASEFVVLARKPLSESTVAENVLRHGCGALNIGATRIETGGRPKRERDDTNGRIEKYGEYAIGGSNYATGTTTEGRYPANLVLSHAPGCDEQCVSDCPVRMLDEQSGSVGGTTGTEQISEGAIGWGPNRESIPEGGYGDEGGASRFYYTSKASPSEREINGYRVKHPTVKPVDLMEWLVKLVTADEQTVLDPFAGTGTTCLAARNTGREFVGIERQAKWVSVAQARCGLTPDDPSVLRGEGEVGLEAFAATDGGEP